MILCDASALIALVNIQDPGHERCAKALPLLSPPLKTTAYCFSEAMHITGQYGGWHAQKSLWQWPNDQRLLIHRYQDQDLAKMYALMEKYKDIPMDLADASLVVVAEDLNQRRIFTLDKDFYVYRLRGNRAFDVVPQRQ